MGLKWATFTGPFFCRSPGNFFCRICRKEEEFEQVSKLAHQWMLFQDSTKSGSNCPLLVKDISLSGWVRWPFLAHWAFFSPSAKAKVWQCALQNDQITVQYENLKERNLRVRSKSVLQTQSGVESSVVSGFLSTLKFDPKFLNLKAGEVR